MLYRLYIKNQATFKKIDHTHIFLDSSNILCIDNTLDDAKEMTHAEKQEQNKLMGISFFASGLFILFLGLLILLILVKVC